jgi:chromosome segregation ATPase
MPEARRAWWHDSALAGRAGADATTPMKRYAPALWLALAAFGMHSNTSAQGSAKPAATAPGKLSTLGDARPGGKLLTREELRECLKQQSELSLRRPKVEAERDAVQRARDELKQIDDGLKTEREAIEGIKTTVASLNERSKALSQKISDYNARYSQFVEANRTGPTAERQRASFEREKAEVDASAEALDAERKAFTPKAELTLKTYNERITSRDLAASEWNARSTKVAQVVQSYETDRETWTLDCAGRPYREDDEIAIKAGK